MKKLFLMLLMVAGVAVASAQSTDTAVSQQVCTDKPLSERKPVTSKWSLISGGAAYSNHFLSNQQYIGSIKGIEAVHGRYFRKSDNLSWRLTLAHLRNMEKLGGGLKNPAKTSKMSVQTYEADYAVFYNWKFGKEDRLQVRAGGSFNVYGGLNLCGSHSVNNVVSADLQTQILGAAQIRYGWDFNKWGLDLYANLSIPMFGLIFGNARYESFIEGFIPSDLNLKAYQHTKFSSFHNMKGANFEMGIDFALRKNVCLNFGYATNNRYWHINGLQDYRTNSVLKIGVSVDLVSVSRRATTNRQF